MNKNDKVALILKDHQEWRLGGDGEPTNPQVLTSAINHAIDALITQAAEMQAAIVELKQVLDVCNSFKLNEIVKDHIKQALENTKKWSE